MGFVTGFDLDLTLIDSTPSLTHSLAVLGMEIDGTPLENPVTGIRDRMEVHLAAQYPDRDPVVMVERFRTLYREQAIGLASLLPGAAAAVAAARQLGGVVVITGKLRRNAALHLDHVGLAVDTIVGGRTGTEKAETLGEFGVSVYVGDQVEDMAAARAAGVAAVGVTTGLDTNADLTAAGADVVIASLLELPALLRRLATSLPMQAERPQ